MEEGSGSHFFWCILRGLPAKEMVLPSTLAAAKGKSNQPYHGEDDRGNPQQMDSKSSAEEDQDQQQSEYEYHATSSTQLRFTRNFSADIRVTVVTERI